jgi:sugar/nucleoside kinase (ribokinase family)
LLLGHVTRGLVATTLPQYRPTCCTPTGLPSKKWVFRVRMSSTSTTPNSPGIPKNNIRNEDHNNSNNYEQVVVLLIGSLGLDRLLTVQTYPEADAKVRTISYSEMGGGNSANTASAMGKLVTAEFLSSNSTKKNIQVRLLTKVGDDSVGRQLRKELDESNVDTKSPLFLVGTPGTTTSFTTVIVSQEEQTRTCIHTPGTVGELSLEDVCEIDFDDLFQDVVHLHSDSRHTDVSLLLAKEAKKRGILISCDVEKDRETTALDELIQICDILFTNSNHLGSYLKRLSSEMESTDHQNRRPLPEPEVSLTALAITTLHHGTVTACIRSLQPSAFLTRWCSQLQKEVVVTQGSMGSFHYKPLDMSITPCIDLPSNTIKIDVVSGSDGSTPPMLSLWHSFCDGTVRCETMYRVLQSGVLQDLTIVDTTGAGDAFIGGYLISKIAFIDPIPRTERDRAADAEMAQFALELASFVAGRKLEGPGARSALPSGNVVDFELGKDLMTVRSNLRKKLRLAPAMNDANTLPM